MVSVVIEWLVLLWDYEFKYILFMYIVKFGKGEDDWMLVILIDLDEY